MIVLHLKDYVLDATVGIVAWLIIYEFKAEELARMRAILI